MSSSLAKAIYQALTCFVECHSRWTNTLTKTSFTELDKYWKRRNYVRCHPPDSPVHGPSNSSLSKISAYIGYISPDHPRGAPDRLLCQQPTTSGHAGPGLTVMWCTGRSGATHRLVRCPSRSRKSPIRGSLAVALFTVRCASDSLVHPWTKGNQGLSNGAPTAHRYLGAIKRDP